MNLRIWIASLILVLLPCLDAFAAEPSPPDPSSTPARAVSVSTGVGLMWIHTSHAREPFDPTFPLSIAPSYRVSPRMSFGALLSFGRTLDGLNVWRASGEGRVDLVRTGAFDAWGAGEAGLLFAKLIPLACGDCGAWSDDVTATRVAPLFGAGVGADVMPVPYLSLGLETRALLSIFGSKVSDDSVPSRVTPAFVVMLNVGFHLPLEATR